MYYPMFHVYGEVDRMGSEGNSALKLIHWASDNV